MFYFSWSYGDAINPENRIQQLWLAAVGINDFRRPAPATDGTPTCDIMATQPWAIRHDQIEEVIVGFLTHTDSGIHRSTGVAFTQAKSSWGECPQPLKAAFS
jgi:hypothetical protein